MNKNELLARLQPDMIAVDEAMRHEIAGVGTPLLRELLEYGLFNGGKRFRPLLTVLAGRLCAFARMPAGLAPEEDLVPPPDLYRLALIFEFLHCASLLHDDVIDHADRRRGKPAVSTVWGSSHAILAGDFLHTRAMTLAGSLGGKEILEVIGAATAAMIEAEFLQARTVADGNLSEENYFAVLRGKTGALISAACRVGACFAEAEAAHQAALTVYGNALGLAFQVVDDLLDYLGDPATTGKAVGNDFIEGKLTLPLLHALTGAGSSRRQEMATLLAASPAERAGQVAAARRFIEEGNGFTYAIQGAETLVEAAEEALAVFPDCQARRTLIGLARYVLTRQQ